MPSERGSDYGASNAARSLFWHQSCDNTVLFFIECFTLANRGRHKGFVWTVHNDIHQHLPALDPRAINDDMHLSCVAPGQSQ